MFESTSSAAAPAWLADLNPEQHAAATNRSGHLLVLAGAGTGKTTTLCARVASLVADGVPAERVLLLTFTRRAAREMLERAQALTGGARSPASRVLGGTFHAVAHRFVRANAGALGLSPDFGLLDAGDAADLLDLVRQEQGHGAGGGSDGGVRRFPRKQTLTDIYSRTVNAQLPLRDILAHDYPWCDEHREALAGLFKAYTARKRALGVLDLDDLLLFWRALVADAVAGPHVAAAFDHVLVDEYQDVNGIQVDIVRALADNGCTITAVGDDFQAIYGFRSASADHILGFPEQLEGATTITLERNYRAPQPLLDVANGVAAQDQRGFPKRLRAQRSGGKRPTLVFCRDQTHEAVEVAERVLAAREEGMLLREQAVLARTSHDSDLLELELSRRRIPYVKYGGLRYMEAAHVKDYLAALRLTDRPTDEMAWFRLLQLLEGIGPARARRAVDHLVTTGTGVEPQIGAEEPPPLTLDRAAELAGDAAPFVARERPALSVIPGDGVETEREPTAGEAPTTAPTSLEARWTRARKELPSAALELADPLVAAIAAGADERRPGPLAERLQEAVAPLVRAHYADGAIRVQDLAALAGAAGEATDVRTFVAELLLDPPASASDLAGPPLKDEDWLTLSTVHSAKGLEWQAVHVLAAYDGNFPACLAAGTSEEIDEERRLFYVALTRARRELVVYVPRRYYHRPQGRDDGHGYGKPSRFLTADVMERFDVQHLADDPRRAGFRAAPAGRRITVSVDSLFD